MGSASGAAVRAGATGLAGILAAAGVGGSVGGADQKAQASSA